MTMHSCFLFLVFLASLLMLAWPLSIGLQHVADGRPIAGLGWLARLEHVCYRIGGVRPDSAMSWRRYAIALLVFNAMGALFVYALQRAQAWLPFNPADMVAVSPDSAFNTAVSFVTNTNWQGYSGEATMSYLTQMLALGGQNFFSAATGIAVAFALIRGFVGRSAAVIGNFWVDLTRIVLYVLLPLSIIVCVILMSQGVIQTFGKYQEISLVEPVAFDAPVLDESGQPKLDTAGKPLTNPAVATTQTLAMGPVASQEAIKNLGTNGGGFFNANAAHPFENPNAITNIVEMLSILLIPAALCLTFGRMVGDRRQGWTLLLAMTLLFALAWCGLTLAEHQSNPLLHAFGVDQHASISQAGGNMEGKEVRFGIDASSLFATVTTAASAGAVNGMHDSFMPLGGMMPMVLIQLGEVVFGGTGSGLYGMLLFAILAVFIAGLMIGRTPEYLGKKIQAYEMKMTAIAILVTPLLVLVGTALAVLLPQGLAGLANPGAHGFSEILYAFSSAANNNGSAFAGLSANTPFYNDLLAVAMWFGRFGMIVPVLAIAGSLAAKHRLPVTAGTLPTHGPLFLMMLIGVLLLVGVLNYVPALALGPVIEQLQLTAN